MENFRKVATRAVIVRAKIKAESSPKTLINLFNSGYVIDIKKLKIMALKLAEKINENIK